MNQEALKQTLLEIIEEARNLPESELEIIPETTIKVKKGRIDEFKAYARFYSQLKNNLIINSNDYLNTVYTDLIKELRENKEEEVISKAYDLYNANKNEIERFNALKQSLNNNHLDQDRYNKKLEELKKKDITDTKVWQEITNLQNTLTTLKENENIIKNAMIEIKNNVNKEIRKTVESEMTYIRNAYLSAKLGTATGFGLDGESILANDKETYDNLYILLRIIENVNEKDPIVCVNNTICVNPHQIEAVQELLSKIDLLQLANRNETKEFNENPNNKLMADISKEIERLKGLLEKENNPSYQSECDKLFKILNYLNKANEKEFALTPIWNIAYVNGPDRESFIDLIKSTTFFHGYDPDNKLIEENEKLISNLKEYLTILEDKVKNYQGQYNIPLSKVKDSIVLSEDKEEYENILAIISILENSTNNLIKVNESGNVTYQNLSKYKDLINKTKYFSKNKNQVTEKNEIIIKEIENNLTELIKKAKNTPNAILAPDKEILATDLEEYDLLSQQYKILKSVDANKPVMEIDGALINNENVFEYQKLLEALEDSKSRKVIESSTQASGNIADNLDNNVDSSVIIPTTEANESVNSSEPIDIEPVNLTPTAPVENPTNTYYKDLTEENELENSNLANGLIDNIKEKFGKIKKVKAIRKAKKYEWWKKHKKQVILIGLLLAVISFTLPSLIPAMIYANSCLAQAAPILAGITGSINHTLAGLIGGLGAVNYNIAAGYTLQAMLVALGKMGIIGLSTYATMKTLFSKKSDNISERLPDPFKKDLIDKIKEFGHNLVHDRERAKEQVNNAGNIIKEAGMNAIYNIDSKNIDSNKELMDAKIAYDANYMETYPEIPTSVNNNDLEEAQERIDERARHMESELGEISFENYNPKHMKEETFSESEELDIENIPSHIIKLPAEIPDDWDIHLLENAGQGRGKK